MIIFAYWRERQGIMSDEELSVLTRCPSSLKSEGLMKISTRVSTKDETHLGVQQARRGINYNVVIPLVSLGLHSG